MSIEYWSRLGEDFPPSLLVISSRVTDAYAAAVRSNFQERGFIVDLSEQDIVGINDQFLETMLNRAGYYDFCIAVMGADMTPSEIERVNDNIYFEFGLLLGRLGPYRAFPLIERGVRLFRDWEGVKVVSYDRSDDPDSAVADACANIAEAMEQAANEATLTMLPSTSLAIGYYNNFIERVVTALSLSPTVQLQGPDGTVEREINPQVDDLTIDVRVPRDLRELIPQSLSQHTAEFRRIVVETPIRSFPFYVEADMSLPSDPVKLIDVPTTLLSAYYAHEKIFSEDFLGEPGSPMRQRLQDREIQNFEDTLRRLLPDPTENKFFRFTVVE
jgi:hypothetical protein